MKQKKISLPIAIISILLSFTIIIGNKIVFKYKLYEDNYLIDTYSITDILLGIFIIIASYLIILFFKHIYLKMYNFTFKNPSKNKFIFCLFSAIILIFVIFIYFFTFYPGGIYIDTHTSFKMMKGKIPFTSHHPVLYTLSLKIVLAFKHLEIGFCVFALLQITFMIFTLIYFIYWLLNKGINKYIALLVTLFFALFKLYPLYSISIWKDTPFSLSLLLYTLTFIDLIIEASSQNIKKLTIIKFNIFTLLVIFLRNNRNIYNTYLFNCITNCKL